MRLKIDWASLIVGRKFTGFALFYFVFEGNFQVRAPLAEGRGLYLEGQFSVTSSQELIFGEGLIFGILGTVGVAFVNRTWS